MNNEPIILAIETALGTGSISILRGGLALGSLQGMKEVSRSQDLLIMISGLVKENYLELKDIELIAVSVGPGSFTGVRVGLAVAKALAFGLNCPCVGVPVLEALTGAIKERKGTAFTIIGAGRNQFFWQKFSFPGAADIISHPQVGGLDNFLDEISSIKSGGVSVIFEADLNQIINLEVGETVEMVNASDKVSDLIGVRGLLLTKKSNTLIGTGHPELSPLYVRPADILNKKTW